MLFALVNNKRERALPGLSGICPFCGQKMIAKCGTQRINHWAHNNTLTCDNWQRTETEWHRAWKNEFPQEWQEVIFNNSSVGEKHIADVYTEHGIVLEFQHSHLNERERYSREYFYGKMIWVVDALRLKGSISKLVMHFKDSMGVTKTPALFLTPTPEQCFPQEWTNRSVPVVFDYGNPITIDDKNNSYSLFCLFPRRVFCEVGKLAIVYCMSRLDFINHVIPKDLLSSSVNDHIVNNIVRRIKAIPDVDKESMALYIRQNRLKYYYDEI
ncbi:MAG TPA: hypothetical protein H9933_07505 [Candidatus Alistipes merdavium]|nr:hypothetical protein [Candidatus Alistipes merdavium]